MSKLQELQAQQAAIEKAIAEEKTKGKRVILLLKNNLSSLFL